MSLKNLLKGSAFAVAILWSQFALAWDWNAQQRGWVDSVFLGPFPSPLPPNSQPATVSGWACVRPDLFNGVTPPATFALYQGGPPGIGYAVPGISFTSYQYPAVVELGGCGNNDNGFVISFAPIPNVPMSFYVTYNGPYGQTLLEGAH
ncbi:hypothetical protein [Hyalangium versicolor]|uniref:hypothetical protein n=1 Tax=Hyalangium versicolor TaxID=2861190 RepID=UPI001CD03C8E|nr:hypothetical protein [Hyalangium versicolor]